MLRVVNGKGCDRIGTRRQWEHMRAICHWVPARTRRARPPSDALTRRVVGEATERRVPQIPLPLTTVLKFG